MPQTFYATQDEEILSIVGKLRSSELLENVFIIPKRALVLQSIVNLRMLAREAEKAGKQVVIVTQDENGRRLAEKAGLVTRPYSEETSREPEPVILEMPTEEPTLQHVGVSADSIGSSGFFATTEETRAPQVYVPSVQPAYTDIPALPTESAPVSADGMRLRIRNASPVRQTALNSLRSFESVSPAYVPVASPAPAPVHDPVPAPVSRFEIQNSNYTPAPMVAMAPQPIVSAPVFRNPIPVSAPIAHEDPSREIGPGRLSQIFSPSRQTIEPQPAPKMKPRKDSPRRREPDTTVDGNGKALFAFFVTISILFLLGTGAFILLPKAEIAVIPQSITKDLVMEFEGNTGSSVTGENVIPMRLIEKEEEITITGTATGAATGNGSKASGKIIIYNEFGADSQPLVATTRFQSSNGKIFRLSKGVTVPGATIRSGQTEPGIVEAEVIADATGKEYNVGSTDFSIPGFSGSSKAGKIYAKSKSSMIGGSSSGASGATAVATADIDQAKGDALSKFRESFKSALMNDVAGNERFIEETFEVAPVGSPSAPSVGSVASTFEYKVTYHGKAFVFSEDELKDKAISILRTKSSVGAEFVASNVTFHYDAGTPDYATGALHFKVGVNLLFVATIDTAVLRDAFLGKKQEEMKQILDTHPEVKNIEIELKPKGLFFAVPKDPSRVTVTVSQP